MIISQVVGITGARLINEPRISAVEGLCFFSNKTRRGDLFVAKTHKDIKQALKRGAFGILFEGDFTPIDDEIAWLQTNSLERACGALGRYLIVDYALHCIALSALELSIARLFFPPHLAVFAAHNNINFLEQLSLRFCLDREEDEGLFASNITTNLHKAHSDNLPYIFAQPLFFSTIDIETTAVKPTKSPLRLLASSLFAMRVQYNEHIYTLPLPMFFFDTLKKLVALAQNLAIPIDLSRMLALDGLQLFSFNSRGFLEDYKNTTKTLIVLQNNIYLALFMRYFEKNTPWANKLYLCSRHSVLSPSPTSVCVFDSPKNAIAQIKQSNAHYIIVCCNETETKTILAAFEQPQIQKSLFD